MTRDVIVVPPELTLDVAHDIMIKRRIRHLPVTQGGQLVGMLSDRDILLRARLEGDTVVVPREPVALAMTVDPLSCEPSTPIGQLVAVMTERKIDALPVIASSGRLVGLVTTTDLLLLLARPDSLERLPYTFRMHEVTASLPA